MDYVRVAEQDEGGFIGYRRRDDDKANPTKQKVNREKKTTTAGKSSNPKSVTDFTTRAKSYVDDLRPGHLDLLASWLQLPVTVFDRVPLLGLSRIADGCKVFGFPEHDADGHVCGITERYQNGKKEMQPGGMRGITVPTGWNEFGQTDEADGDGPESGSKSGPKYCSWRKVQVTRSLSPPLA